MALLVSYQGSLVMFMRLWGMRSMKTANLTIVLILRAIYPLWFMSLTTRLSIHSINAGPWKFAGLLGLILEATADGNQYSFMATGIHQTDKSITPVYLANEYEKTDRIKFLKARRSFLDNPLGKINAQFAGAGVTVGKVQNEDGSDATGSIFAPASVVDLIETDYH